MNCWSCGNELIWNNDYDIEDENEYFKLLEKFKSMGYYIYNQDSEDCELKLRNNNSLINNKYTWENSKREYNCS